MPSSATCSFTPSYQALLAGTGGLSSVHRLSHSIPACAPRFMWLSPQAPALSAHPLLVSYKQQDYAAGHNQLLRIYKDIIDAA